MRIRARHVHAFEGLLDTTVGWVINFAAVLLIFNGIYGHDIQLNENVVAGTIMFFLAWGRKYTIRRWANRFIDRLYKRYKTDAKLQVQARED